MTTLLHPALRLLLRMQVRARWRKVLRGAGTAKGKVRLVAIFLLFALAFSPLIFAAVFHEPAAGENAQAMVASILFVLTLLTVVGQGADAGIAFTPAEVDMLFPAPFRRRDLLLYRLAGLAMGSVISALFFSVAGITYAVHWVFAFLGFALAGQFIQLIAIILGLTVSMVGQAAYTRGRKTVLIAVAVLVLIAAVQTGGYSSAVGTTGWVQQFAKTPVGAIVLAPFSVYAAAITAKQLLPGFVGWAVLAGAVNAMLVVLALRLDANFLERSVTASQKAYLKLQRLRAGQGWMNLSRPSAIRWRVPMPARWRGAGPIAWRQLIAAMRGSRGIIYFVLISTGIMGFSLGSLPDLSFARLSYGLLPMMAVTLLPQMLKFDFRGDFDSFDTLKTLPISPSAITVGELIAPTVFATVLELPFVFAIGFSGGEMEMMLMLAAFMPVLNLLIFAMENLIFLWYPQRFTNTAELAGMGRRMVVTMAKVVSILAVAAFAAAVGFLVLGIFSQMWLAVATSWLVVAAFALLSIPVVAQAFRRLDVTAIKLD